MRRIAAISRKYDGSLRDVCEPYLYSETEDAFTLFSLPGLPCWSPRKAAWVEGQDGIIEIYARKK